MLKLAGGIITIVAASLMGAYAAAELEASYQEMLYLRRLMAMIQGEIRYSRSLLSHIFLKISKEAKKPYDAWLRQMCVRMESRKGGSFAEIWRESAGLCLGSSRLPRREKKRLEELGALLGDMDAEMQIGHLRAYQEQLALSIQDMREDIQNKKKLCRCMGVISGILIAVLLI